MNKLIYCNCGCKRGGEGSKPNLYYRCYDRQYQYPFPKKCFEKGIRADVADQVVWKSIMDLMSSDKLIKEQAKKWLKRKPQTDTPNRKLIESIVNQINDLNLEEKRYLKAYGKGTITDSQLEAILPDIKLKKTALEKQVQNYREEIKKCDIIKPDLENIDVFVEKTKELLKDLSFEKKKQIVRSVVDKVIGNQQQLQIFGYLPVDKNVKFKTECRDCGIA